MLPQARPEILEEMGLQIRTWGGVLLLSWGVVAQAARYVPQNLQPPKIADKGELDLGLSDFKACEQQQCLGEEGHQEWVAYRKARDEAIRAHRKAPKRGATACTSADHGLTSVAFCPGDRLKKFPNPFFVAGNPDRGSPECRYALLLIARDQAREQGEDWTNQYLRERELADSQDQEYLDAKEVFELAASLHAVASISPECKASPRLQGFGETIQDVDQILGRGFERHGTAGEYYCSLLGFKKRPKVKPVDAKELEAKCNQATEGQGFLSESIENDKTVCTAPNIQLPNMKTCKAFGGRAVKTSTLNLCKKGSVYYIPAKGKDRCYQTDDGQMMLDPKGLSQMYTIQWIATDAKTSAAQDCEKAGGTRVKLGDLCKDEQQVEKCVKGDVILEFDTLSVE